MRQLLCLTVLWVTVVPAHAQSLWAREVLSVHNDYRAQVRVPPLAWDDALAAAAAAWALEVGGSARLMHSVGSARRGQGENLWIGTAGAFTTAQAIGRWGAERANYVAGVFPNVSRAGSLETVAHYTQMVWRQTTRIGCGRARTGAWDVLVCRYSSPGNVIGEMAY